MITEITDDLRIVKSFEWSDKTAAIGGFVVCC